MRIQGWRLGLAAGGLLVLTGCSQKLTYERWQTLHVGASPEAVELTLGEPWKIADDTWVYSDDDRGISSTVTFSDSKMAHTQWHDPQHVGAEIGEKPALKPGESDEMKIQEFDKK